MNSIDFKLINDPLEELLKRTINRLEREFSEEEAFLFRVLLLAAQNSYNAIRTLVIKDPKFGAPAKTICRSILDIVFSVTLLCNDYVKYSEQYFKAGWRTNKETLDRYSKNNSIKETAPEWINEFNKFIKDSAKRSNITDEEKSNPGKIEYYPNASWIVYEKGKYFQELEKNTQELLSFLMNEFYSQLSEVTHVTYPGLHFHVAPLLPPGIDDSTKNIFISEPVLIAIMSILIILSEVNLTLNMGENIKLKELWTYMSSTAQRYKDVYEIKYQNEL